jgi:hypothetical protein
MTINLGNGSSFTEGQIMDTIQNTGNIGNEKIKKIDKKISGIDSAMDNHVIDNRSIIARSRNSVLQFPIYCTQSIRVNEAQIISKLFERVYTSFVQTALAQNPIIDENEVNNLVFLKQFHSNLKESADLELYNEFYKPVDDLDSIMKESVFYSEWVTPTMNVEFRICHPNTDLVKENDRLMNEPLTGLRYLLQEASPISSKVVSQDQKETRTETEGIRLSYKDIEAIAIEDAKITREERELYNKSDKDIKNEIKERYPNYDDDEIEEEIDDTLMRKAEIAQRVDKAIKDFKDDAKKPINDPTKKHKAYNFDGHAYIVTKNKGATITKKSVSKPPIDSPKILRDADIKKINGMLPYTIEATFRVRNKEKNESFDVHFIIGIKSVLHLINVNDLQEDLQDLVTGNVKSLQKVKYKTGEIKFMDYVFNFKGLKKDAAKRVDGNKRWINSLKRMADYSKLGGSMYKSVNDELRKGDRAIPNGTIILSQSDVTGLITNTGIDLSKVSNAKRLAKSLFLIAVAIVDPSAGSMKVLFPDTDNDWDIQSLASIDAELAKTDNSQIMRELNRMVNK